MSAKTEAILASAEPITLASGSPIRAAILKNAGVVFAIAKSGVDEVPLKEAHLAGGGTLEDVPRILAEAKARAVSATTSGVVLGADQVLIHDGVVYDKVDTMDAARDRLRVWRGSEHRLVGHVAAVRDGTVLEGHTFISPMAMRDLSEAELDRYLDRAGPDILQSVGCYQFEGLGAQLFETAADDHSAIYGLALMPTLAMLRRHAGLTL